MNSVICQLTIDTRMGRPMGQGRTVNLMAGATFLSHSLAASLRGDAVWGDALYASFSTPPTEQAKDPRQDQRPALAGRPADGLEAESSRWRTEASVPTQSRLGTVATDLRD